MPDPAPTLARASVTSTQLLTALEAAREPERVGRLAAHLGRAARAGLAVVPGAVLTVDAVDLIRTDGLRPSVYRIPGEPAGAPSDPINAALAHAWHVIGRSGLAPVTVRLSTVTGPVADGQPAGTWAELGETVQHLTRSTERSTSAVIVERQLGVRLSGAVERRSGRGWQATVDGGDLALHLRRWWPQAGPRWEPVVGRVGRRLRRELLRAVDHLDQPFTWALGDDQIVRITGAGPAGSGAVGYDRARRRIGASEEDARSGRLTGAPPTPTRGDR